MEGWEDRTIRMSRLGRLPPPARVDLSLPSATEGVRISHSNNSLDSLNPRVDRYINDSRKMDAFIQAQLAMEKKAAVQARKEQLRMRTNSRSQGAFQEFKKQFSASVSPKKPWKTSMPRPPKYQRLHHSTEKPSQYVPQRISPLRNQAQDCEAYGPLSLPSQPFAGGRLAGMMSPESTPRDVRQVQKQHPSPAAGEAPKRQSRPAEGIEEVASASHYGRDVTPAPGAEAEVPEIEDVVLPWEVRGGDAEEGHSPREELLAGELQELTIRDGIAVVMEGIAEEAEEEGHEATFGDSVEDEALPPWIHPLGNLPNAADFQSSIRLVTQAGQRARENLARFAGIKQDIHKHPLWHEESMLGARSPAPYDFQRTPFKEVVLHKFNGAADEEDELPQGMEPLPRRKMPRPTNKADIGLRDPVREMDPGTAVYPRNMKSRPSWNSSARATYEARARDAGITLPSLCNCHTAAPLDPKYTDLCSRNCPLYQNIPAWEAMVKCMLGAYDLL